MANPEMSTVEIWARIEKDEEGYPTSQDWEDLWASPLTDGLAMIQSIPFFVKNVAVGDIAATVRTEDGRIVLQTIVERSGHSTFRIWPHQRATAERDGIMGDLKDRGAGVELTIESLIAIDAPPERESEIWNYLETGEKANRWDLQVGYSPE
jgi:hypothetical protein